MYFEKLSKLSFMTKQKFLVHRSSKLYRNKYKIHTIFDTKKKLLKILTKKLQVIRFINL